VKNTNLELRKEEDRHRLDKVLAILLEADMISFGKLVEKKNNKKNKQKKQRQKMVDKT